MFRTFALLLFASLCLITSPLQASPLNAADNKSHSSELRQKKEKKQTAEAPNPLKLSCGDALQIGDMYEQEERPCSFTMTNTSAQPIVISNIASTCSCTVLKSSYKDVSLAPGESLDVEFTMLGSNIDFSRPGQSFVRFLLVVPLNVPKLKVKIIGRLLQAATVSPARTIKFEPQKTPVGLPVQKMTLETSPSLKTPLVLEESPENKYFNLDLKKLSDGKYDLTISQKSALPYNREFRYPIYLPIKSPENANRIYINVEASIAETVAFAPEIWTISKQALTENGSFTGTFVYGEVPGIQEENALETADNKSKFIKMSSKQKQPHAVPLKYVKEHHDWQDLQSNLKYDVPENVKLDVINHPQGIELHITVSEKSFEDLQELTITPYREEAKCIPITIKLVD